MPFIVIVEPFVPVHVAIALLLLVKVTGLSESPPVAETVNGASPKLFAVKALKLIVWLVLFNPDSFCLTD